MTIESGVTGDRFMADQHRGWNSYSQKIFHKFAPGRDHELIVYEFTDAFLRRLIFAELQSEVDKGRYARERCRLGRRQSGGVAPACRGDLPLLLA